MKNTYFLILGLFLSHIVLNAQPITQTRVYFDSNSSELSADSQQKLDAFLESIKGVHFDIFDIAGFTDSDGSIAYNEALSEGRARSVSNYLHEKGFPNSKILMTYYGELEASAFPASVEDKQNQRNVTLSLANRYIPNAALFAPFKKEPQVFTIDAGRDTVLVGQQGTIIEILAYSLVDMDGIPARGEIQFKLNEYYKKSDMLLAGLHTMSGTTLLESAGMLYMEASSGDTVLRLRNDADILITNPNENMPEDMQIYQGNERNDLVDWQLQGGVPRYRGEVEFIPIDDDGIEIDPAYWDSIYASRTWYRSAEDSIWYHARNDWDRELRPRQRRVNRLGWINWDKLLKVREGTKIRVNIPNKKKMSSTRIIFKSRPTIMVPGYDNGTEVLFGGIPIKLKATVITMVMDEKQLLFDSKEITVSRNMIIKMDPQPSDATSIQEYLQTLDL